MMILAGLAPLDAQTAYFSGATAMLLGNGLNDPYGVAIDSAGNVFIADTSNNQVKEVFAAGGYTTVKVLATGFLNPMGVAVDRSGNVFVADTSNNAVKEILAASGNVITIASGLHNPYGIAVDGADNVFVADTFNNAVEELMAPGYSAVTTVGSGFNIPTGLAVDGNGNVFVADYGNAAVKEVLAASGYATVVTFVTGYAGPSGVAVDPSGNIFFADTYVGHIDELVAASGYTTVKVYGSGLNNPTGVAVDGHGNLFVAEQGSSAIQEIMTQAVNLGSTNIATTASRTSTLSFTFLTAGAISAPAVLTQGSPAGDYVDAGTGDTCVAGTYNALDTCTVSIAFTPRVSGTRLGAVTLNNSSGSAIAAAYLLGTGLGPQLTFSPPRSSEVSGALAVPAGVAVDSIGNLFVADTGHNAVKKIVANGGYSTVLQLGSGFSSPAGVALDGAGNLFVADSGNNSVKEILAAGGYTAVVTIGGGFSAPQGVAVDSFGNVFVADTGSNSVKEIFAAGGYTAMKALGSGFAQPTGVAVDGSGNVFVADSGNGTVKEILASGGYMTVVQVGSGFATPKQVAVDGGGNVFVADSGNHTVEEILAAGGYVTINALSGTFSDPVSVAVDGSGNVFVADSGNNEVLKLDFVDPPSLDFASTPVGTTSEDSPQIVTLRNIGNLPLTFPPLGSGLNPAISNGFSLDSTSTCPQVSSASSPAILTAASSCVDSISFAPTAGGAITGSLNTQDDSLNAAPPEYINQIVTLNGTATATNPTILFSVPNHLYGDPPFVVEASSNATGAFTYSVVSGPATVAGTTVTITGAGTIVLRASEAADSNYVAGFKDANFVVAPAAPAIVFSVPDHSAGDAPFLVSASSNGTGMFTYSVVSGPATVAGSTVTLTGAGAVVLRASEAADANYATGSKDATFTVSAVTPTIVFNVPDHVYGDAAFAVSAASNSTGAFTYSVVSGPATIAGATVNVTGAGTVVLRAFEGADATYSSGSKDATFTVVPAAPAIIFNVPNHTSGDTAFTVGATSNSSGAFTYSIVSGPASIAGATITLTGAGTVVVRASEAADMNYAAGSRDATFSVAGVTPAITFTVPNHQYGDAPFVVSATSNSTGAFTYSVVSGPASITGATVMLTGSGEVVLQTVEAASGGYSAGSVETTFTVAGSILLTTKPDTATALPGSPANFTLQITPGGGATFANAVTFAAYGLPDGYSYAFSPVSLPAGSAATPVTLTVQTSTAAANSGEPFSGGAFAPLAFAFLALPLFGTRGSRTLLRKMACRPMALFILALSMSAVFGLAGCGSGVFEMPHKYNIAVIASDAVTGATATTQVSLIVQ